MSLSILAFLIYSLAVHRLSELLRRSSLCLSIPVALFGYFHRRLWDWLAFTGDVLIIALAYSAVAVLLNRIPKR